MNISKDTWIAVVIAVVVLALFFGTMFFYQGNDNETNTIMNDQTSEATSTVGTIETRQNGLVVQDLAIGAGAEARAGNQVTVNYVGTLENGTVFDSSFSRNRPLSFPLGVGNVIQGWDEGVVGMKVGGTRKLIIPANLAYGPQSVGQIPPNSTLIFEVTLLDVQ